MFLVAARGRNELFILIKKKWAFVFVRKAFPSNSDFLVLRASALCHARIVCILLDRVFYLFSQDSPTELFGSDLLFKKRKEIMRFNRVLIFFH